MSVISSISGEELPCTGGSVSFETGDAAVRARTSLEFQDPNLIPTSSSDPLAPFGQELTVSREGVQLGVFRIVSVAVSELGGGVTISVEALDRASRIIDQPMLGAEEDFGLGTTIASGEDYNTTILEIIQGAWSAVPYVTGEFPTGDVTPRLTWTEGDDRWAFAQDMAFFVGQELYFDRSGTLRMIPIPEPTATPVMEIAEGEGGVLLSIDRNWTRDESANRYIVTGENSSGAPVRGDAQDDNDNSPTKYGGPFGRVTKFFSSEFIVTTDSAQQAAEGMLNRNRGIAQSIDFGAIVNPELDIGDSIMVRRERLNVDEVHVVDTLTIPLNVEDSMSGTTRTVQVIS